MNSTDVITVSAEHFDTAKYQAYRVKESLELESMAVADMGSSMWLNFWAGVLGYRDWGSFQHQTKHGHKTCSNNLIITRQNLGILCSRIQACLYQQFDNDYLQDALFRCATEAEQATFDQPPCYKEPMTVHLALMPSDYQRLITDYLFDNLRFRPYYTFREDEMKKRVLASAKQKREHIKSAGGKKVEIIKACADVYPNSGHTFESIFQSCLDAGYIERVPPCQWEETTYRLSDYCLNTYHLTLTQDYGLEYVLWRQKLDNAFDNAREVCRLSELDIIKAFADGVAPEDYSPYLDIRHEEISAVDTRVMAETGIGYISNQQRFLHLVPEVFLSDFCNHKTSDATLTINVTSGQQQFTLPKFILKKPYPNKRYIVACSENGVGLFVALPEDCHSLHIEYHWQFPSRTVRHTINAELEQLAGNRIYNVAIPHGGRLYSVLNPRQLMSYCDTAEDFYNFHPRGLTLQKAILKNDALEMEDQVTLIPDNTNSCYFKAIHK